MIKNQDYSCILANKSIQIFQNKYLVIVVLLQIN